IILGSYSFNRYKTGKEKPASVTEAAFICSEKCSAVLNRAKTVCENTLLCRDLVNETSEKSNPEAIAALAKKSLPKTVRCAVLDSRDIEKAGMGLFSAVARGSIYGARLLIMQYRGNPSSKDATALVGKGITFDSGGYNLKPTGHIEDMRSDMAGGAAVIYAMKSIAELRLKKNVIAFVPLCENMIGSKASKPGDIFTAIDGTTVEILSTDAEGRLILADTIGYAVKKFKPSRIIEASTLTGACITALGEEYAALMATDSGLSCLLAQAAESTGEKLWPLPLDEAFDKDIESDIADLRNINPEKKAGTIIGGTFLKKFAKDTPFAHIDIAGTAWLSKERGVSPKYATGFGVRLFTETVNTL
ncbi:MAG: leucyl aminopeptidase family protein, partial [Spirochaetota bacterium]